MHDIAHNYRNSSLLTRMDRNLEDQLNCCKSTCRSQKYNLLKQTGEFTAVGNTSVTYKISVHIDHRN